MDSNASYERRRRGDTDRAFFLRGMRGTLLAWFVLLALVPMALVSVISYTRAQKALTRDAKDKVVAVLKIKENILMNNFERWELEILFVSRMESLKSDMVDMAAGFKFIGADRLKSFYSEKADMMDAGDGSAYSVVHGEEHRFFQRYSKVQKYEDVLLINPAGEVIYTRQKNADFGVDLTAGSYRESNLGRLYEDLKTSKPGEVLVADAALYGKGVALFMGTPVYREETCLGYLVFRLPLKYISKRMGEREGMGRTGETYLVGQDLLMRSDSYLDPAGRNVKTSLAGTVKGNGADTPAVRQALEGKAGVGPNIDYMGGKVLSAYRPFEFKGVRWAMLSEINLEEALAPAAALGRIMAGLAVAVALLALILSVAASGRIVRPIRRLTEWSREIAGGKPSLIDIRVPKNEIGVLNEGFREAVKSLRAAIEIRERQNWLKTGQSELDDRMRGEQDMEALCGNVMNHVAKYLGAQVGALFLNDGDGLFRLMASYAYKTRKNLSNEFKTGEGLVGQAALEKQAILFTNVPEDYITVTSGLGEKRPENILVMPLVFNNSTLGVIEVGSLSRFSEDHRAFLDETSERIAIALQSASARQKLQKALEVSQKQAEELQAQQEELTTANEELEEQTQRLQQSEEKLKAQQEELQVTNEELEEKNDLLDRQKKDVERARKDLEEKAGELAVASKYKSEFLANMSHELRTPLNSLLLLAEGLAHNKEGNLTEEQVESARIVHGAGIDLLNLINEILDLSKIEAGRMDLHLDVVRVSDLSDGVLSSFQHMAEAKGLDLNVVVSEDAPGEVRSDRKRVEQVIRNLVSNAVKFTEKGDVTVTFGQLSSVNGHWEDSEGKTVILRTSDGQSEIANRKSQIANPQFLAVAVSDTGIGIAPEKQKIVFEAFQQAEGGTARKYGGTGLGLSISRELARLLGGEIQLESEPGKGSIFTIYLPINVEKMRKPETGTLKRGTRNAEHGTTSPASTPSSEFRIPTFIPDDRESVTGADRVILVIEDDPNFGRLLYEKCHEKGFKCLAASTGEDGLELAAKYMPEAMILDIRLPGMDGWAVLAALKEDIRTRHIPVHIVSVEESSTEALRKGAVGHATKPLDQERLEETFRRLEQVSAGKPKRVLVVEDDAKIRGETVQLIGDGDVKVDEARNGEQAMQALRSGRYDCMVLDLGLPDMTGGDLLIQLEREGVDLPPVIIHTARDLTSEEEMDLREHAESIVIKDVRSPERLLDEVSLFLHRVVSNMSEKKKRMILNLHESDALLTDKKVLIVDDDMRTTFALSRLLTGRGMKTLKAENGDRALRILEQEPDVDLVLIDIMMPVMDGYETMERIRARDEFRKLPIIALTAKAMPEDRAKCIAAGANDYLTKPVDEERLVSMMRVWLYK